MKLDHSFFVDFFSWKYLFLQVEDKVKYIGEYSSIKGKIILSFFYWKLVTNYDKTFPLLLKHKGIREEYSPLNWKLHMIFFISIFFIIYHHSLILFWYILNILIWIFFNVLAKYFVNATGPPNVPSIKDGRLFLV